MKQKLDCILLIEDSDLTNIYNTKLINKLELTDHVQIAENGQVALDYLLKRGSFAHTNNPLPELILLDINMPVMDGWEFIEEFKNHFGSRENKPIIVMLSTSPNPDDRLKAGTIDEISSYQLKPLTSEILRSLIDTFFIDKSPESSQV